MIFIVVSTGHFDPLIAACSRLSADYEFVGQIGSSQVEPPFSHFKTASPSQLESYMARAELVITHAGTGMLSMLYGLKKKCVVVPKQIRYGEANDGQVELAQKWQELGIGVLCMDVENLRTAIEKCRRLDPVFPVFPSLGRSLRKSLAPHLPQGRESEPGGSLLEGAIPSQQV
ncbi:MAG: glycosyltransferase [Bdellovibrionota bacterium]